MRLPRMKTKTAKRLIPLLRLSGPGVLHGHPPDQRPVAQDGAVLCGRRRLLATHALIEATQRVMVLPTLAAGNAVTE